MDDLDCGIYIPENIPEKCKQCGLYNSENCNTCPEINDDSDNT